MENKQKICELLLPVLQATRNLHDLEDLEFMDGSEVVIGMFASGRTKVVNVEADSGTAMILDIVKQLV